MSRVYLTDEVLHDLIKEERRCNEHLRKRRAAAAGTYGRYDEIAFYDKQIYESDRRLMVLYEKNR